MYCSAVIADRSSLQAKTLAKKPCNLATRQIDEAPMQMHITPSPSGQAALLSPETKHAAEDR